MLDVVYMYMYCLWYNVNMYSTVPVAYCTVPSLLTTTFELGLLSVHVCVVAVEDSEM